MEEVQIYRPRVDGKMECFCDQLATITSHWFVTLLWQRRPMTGLTTPPEAARALPTEGVALRAYVQQLILTVLYRWWFNVGQSFCRVRCVGTQCAICSTVHHHHHRCASMCVALSPSSVDLLSPWSVLWFDFGPHSVSERDVRPFHVDRIAIIIVFTVCTVSRRST